MISIEKIDASRRHLQDVIFETPYGINKHLSEKYDAKIYLKREDLQVVRSFKIRGAYNKMLTLSQSQIDKGIICASAGNHAQGVALACSKLNVRGKIIMPFPTPKQKIEKVKQFGGEWVTVGMHGDTFDDAYEEAVRISEKESLEFIHPFNDEEVIAGQGTVAAEMFVQSERVLDILLVAVGGGGLISGVGSYFKQKSPETKIIAVESAGAPALHASFKKGSPVRLESIDTFADGIAVKEIGSLTFKICQEVVDDIILVPEGKISGTILQLYNDQGLVVEPAGAVSVSALDFIKEEIKGKRVGIIICGGNNDINRTQEITERSLLYEGRKHYFIINFPQRAGALKDFLEILGPKDEVAHISYTKKTNRVNGPAILGIELERKEDYERLTKSMDENNIDYQHINDNPMLYQMLT